MQFKNLFIYRSQNFLLFYIFSVGSKCHPAILLPGSYTTQCVQKYFRRPLVAMDENGNLSKDLFEIPSCCMCVLKTENNY